MSHNVIIIDVRKSIINITGFDPNIHNFKINNKQASLINDSMLKHVGIKTNKYNYGNITNLINNINGYEDYTKWLLNEKYKEPSRIVIWMNRQGTNLYQLLQHYFPNTKIDRYINYVYMSSKLSEPLPSFDDVDCLIIQYTTNKDNPRNYENIIKLFPKNCKICVTPFIIFSGYWGTKPVFENSSKMRCAKHMFGLWRELPIVSSSQFNSNKDSTIKTLRDNEKKCSVKGYADFIENNFNKIRLFDIDIHPNDKLLSILYLIILVPTNCSNSLVLYSQSSNFFSLMNTSKLYPSSINKLPAHLLSKSLSISSASLTVSKSLIK